MTIGQQEHRGATTIALLAGAAPGDPHEPANWAAYRRLAPHILATSPLGDARQDSRSLQLRTITHLINAGDAEAAWSLTHQLHARWQRALGPDHLDTLTAAASLTAALMYLGTHEQAHIVGEDALRRAHRALGPDHIVTQRLASTTITLGMLGPVGSTVEPETPDTEQMNDLAEGTMQRSLRNPGFDHPITLVLSTNLPRALALVLDGDAATAQAECEDALRRSRNSFGPDHLATLGLAATLTLISVLQGLPERARDLGEDTVTRSRTRLGANHFTTLFASAMLALAQAHNGDAEQARDLGEDTQERAGATLGPDHPTTLAAAAAVSISLAQQGATESANTLAADIMTRARNRLGPDHPVTRVLTLILPPTPTPAGHNLAKDLIQDSPPRRIDRA